MARRRVLVRDVVDCRSADLGSQVRSVRVEEDDNAGNPIRFDGVTMDITDLKKALDTLEIERQRAVAAGDVSDADA